MEVLRYVFLVGLYAVATVSAAQRTTYGISKNCTCGFEKLPGRKDGCRNVEDSEYPDHEHLGITEACLPDIPDNTRVCFRTKVKVCHRTVYRGRFFHNNFTEERLRMTENSAFFSPPADSDVRTFCMFKVNMSSNANCSLLRLTYVPDEEDANSLSESQSLRNETSTNSLCRDYLKIGNRKICLSDLARPDALPLIHATSFVAIFWTDAMKDADTISTFDIRAECEVYS